MALFQSGLSLSDWPTYLATLGGLRIAVNSAGHIRCGNTHNTPPMSSNSSECDKRWKSLASLVL